MLFVGTSPTVACKNERTGGIVRCLVQLRGDSLLLLRSSSYKINNSSPFGLCIVNADDTEKLFEKAFKYQPDYFPKGMAIDILKNENQPDLPWTFRLPSKRQKKYENEPIKHESGLSTLTKAIFEYKLSDGNVFLDNFKNEDNLQFIQTSRNWLNLVFDNHRQGKKRNFEKLRLTIEY